MKHLQRFFSNDASGGIILIIAAVLAMLMANLGVTSGLYHAFLETPVQLRVGALEINKNMLLWINDALMAVFFLLIGLEVKREMMQGSLATRRQAIFPVVAALGGMVVPALVYLAFNAQDPVASSGWAIPAATDIAFALGVLALLGSRVPASLKIFLMALAIIDGRYCDYCTVLHQRFIAAVARRRGRCYCGTGHPEFERRTAYRYLYSGRRHFVDRGAEVGCACHAGGRYRGLLYSAA